MNKNYNDLLAFVTVAELGSFTKAAHQLGVSQSALSHTVNNFRITVRCAFVTSNDSQRVANTGR